MRIGIDGTSWSNPRGYGRFARNAVRRLVDVDHESTYHLYVDAGTAANGDFPAGLQLHPVPISRESGGTRSDSSRRLTDLVRLARAVRSRDVDVFLFPSDYTYFPVLRVPTVVGIHDAIANQLPELTLSPGRHRSFWRAKQWLAVKRAARIFTVSEAARSSVATLLGIAARTIAVVPEAPDPVFWPRPHASIEAARTEIGLNAGEAFFLFAGGISPLKNVETLIGAYAQLEASPQRPKLVLVGSLEDGPFVSSAATVRAGIERWGLAGSVVLPGFVDDETLACLYSGATATVLPSLAEGFGLPAVEAAACGSPMVVSDLPAHRESLRDSALYFEPKDITALVDLLRRVSTDAELRGDCSSRSRAAVSRLSWDETAARLHALLTEAATANGRR